jgi:hypothetical protein
MRKQDRLNPKALKTINFETEVLKKLEERCTQEGTTSSRFVNFWMRKILISDIDWARFQAKYHASELAKWEMELKHLSEIAEIKQINGGR